ncbi:hypothetical protein M139_1141 [Bacteroides fragilis str. S23L24]|nr:hypothetical protein M139_1141 [Bacteroides fragilis str. S23L24]
MLDILSFYFVGHFSDSLLSNFLGSVQKKVVFLSPPLATSCLILAFYKLLHLNYNKQIE